MTGAGLIIENTRVPVPGSGRMLEARLTYAAAGWPWFTAVLAGPHPYMGGDLNNNVIRRLPAALAQAGGVAVAFNYSGVGCSTGPPVDVAEAMDRFWATGHAPQDPRLAEDSAAMLHYAQAALPAPLFAAGYSFGCWALVSSLPHPHVRGLILISPTVGRHDFTGLQDAPTTCVISSDNDFLTSPQAMQAWLDEQPCVRRHHRLSASEHFFRGQEDLLAERCAEFIQELLA